MRQGCNLSPTLFNIYINDLAKCFGLTVHDTEMKCFLYADDLVLLSPTKEGLQQNQALFENLCQT